MSMKPIIKEEIPIVRATASVTEFCVAHGISKPMLYKLWKDGVGPKFMTIGSRRYISTESAAEWRRETERRSEDEALPEIEARSQRAKAAVNKRFEGPEPKPKPKVRASAAA
jgi:hypothetical protein